VVNKVGGTAATDEKGVVYRDGDIYAQAAYIFQKIERALQEAGASMSDADLLR
jgi:enamine deaminase RidA (YjgF/YER057c/UK114 family)